MWVIIKNRQSYFSLEYSINELMCPIYSLGELNNRIHKTQKHFTSRAGSFWNNIAVTSSIYYAECR